MVSGTKRQPSGCCNCGDCCNCCMRARMINIGHAFTNKLPNKGSESNKKIAGPDRFPLEPKRTSNTNRPNIPSGLDLGCRRTKRSLGSSACLLSSRTPAFLHHQIHRRWSSCEAWSRMWSQLRTTKTSHHLISFSTSPLSNTLLSLIARFFLNTRAVKRFIGGTVRQVRGLERLLK